MRIGFDVAKVFGPRDGIASYTTSLLDILADRAQSSGGFSLHLYAGDVDAEPEDWERTLGHLPGSVVPHPGRHPDQDDLDLFHTTSFTDTGFFEGPVLFTVHDLTFLTHPEYHRPVNRAHCLRSTLRAVWQDALLAVDSQATADEVRRWFHVAPGRMHVVYPAPSPVFVALEGEERAAAERRLAERLGIEGSFVLSVGALEPRKNLGRLIEAYSALDPALRRGTPLVLVGDGGWKQQSVFTEDWPESVRRLGKVEERDLVALYNAASVVAYPSLVEGFGLPVVEAMACGTPVLTSNVSSLVEVGGDAALCVDPLDVSAIRSGLESLLRDPSLRRRCREAGFERAARFSWQRAADQVIALYGEMARAAD
jgi:alpha-1,3-rhamnosyl/mannosyltransferase